MENLKFSPIKFDSTCNYFNIDVDRKHFPTQFIPNLKNYCRRIIPFVDFYKKQIASYNCTAHEILTKEIPLIMADFPKDRKEMRSIIASLVISFIGLAYEGIFSYLHNKRQMTNTKHSWPLKIRSICNVTKFFIL